MNKYQDFTYDLVPPTWPVCFIKSCPMAEDCIRHLAGTVLSDDVVFGAAVYPTALKNGKCCKFKQIRVIHAAWGFDTIFNQVKRKDSASLRNSIKEYLGGHGTYYRYHNGKLLLTPEQQEWIVSLFLSYGYTENLKFDNYKDIYDFS